jgi:hypothetical protein
MAQKTNLNVSPYYDDFNESNTGARDKNYYKVLFNPGKPVQARELNTLQSILQNQVESFGSHFFKEGSLVIPGNVAFDNQFYAVKLNPTTFGVDISTYIQNFVGKKITGQSSGTTAIIQKIILPDSEIEYVTLYIKYLDSDNDFTFNQFRDNEELSANENITYGNATINSGTTFASTISKNATATGSSVSIGEGVYFIRGNFVRVSKQTIILDYYTNTPSYRIGLKVVEKIITSKDDSNLYDNAKGFTNYAAPGADRFQIELILSKKLLTDIDNDTDFVEILRVKEGAIQKITTKSDYNIIKDYLAQRTYDESGDYSIDPFEISLNNSLNNRIGNDGLFFNNETTDQGNTPSDNLMCVKLSPGKAYVRGYDIEKTGVEILDVNKPRTKQTLENINIPFEMGNLIRVNNVSGSVKQKSTVELYNRRKSSTTTPNGSKIGDARVYTINLTDAAYSNSATNWDLYCFDIQTYTELTLNQPLSATELLSTSLIKGKSSGASGYAVAAGSGSAVININQTSGAFSVGESILINGIELYPRTIKSIKVYSTEDIKSIYQATSTSGFTTAFLADTQLDKATAPGFSALDSITIETNGTVNGSGKVFTGIKTDTIVRYQRPGLSVESFNRVVSISADGSTMTLAGLTNSVTGVCDKDLPSSQLITPFSLGIPKIRNEEKGYLYAKLPDSNVASTNLANSNLVFTAQSNASFTPSSNTLTVNRSNFTLGVTTTSVNFESFDEERYSIFYSDGTVENLTSDKFTLSSNQVTFSDIQNKQISLINATFIKNGIQSKSKLYNRSQTVSVNLSKYSQSGTGINTSINDGLTYNQYYGLRVQDEEICLRYSDVVKVLAVYESLSTSAPSLDTLNFNVISNVDSNAIIGENIIGSTSKAVARVVSKPSSGSIGIVYLNNNRFVAGENVSFNESNISTSINSITLGVYKNITSKFTLDKGQKEQYYDYSKIVRINGEQEPTKQLLIVFDYYSVPSSDTGDVFTVNSYSEERFVEDIPTIGSNVRASDTLDFRPRVAAFTGSSSSPFDFSSRTSGFGSDPKLILSPNESSLVGYDFYLGRIDKLYLDKNGNFIILQGSPSTDPKSPSKPDQVMELATITLPPYLYNPKDAVISLVDNRRYTMRDINTIENRVTNLERVTSLSLLELNTQTLQIRDAQGINRFKTGFFVDDFKNTNLINLNVSSIEIDPENNYLTTKISKNSLGLKPVSAQNVTDENLDLSVNFDLFDSNVKKTGDAITLMYNQVGWIEQPLATGVENVNPFHVVAYNGNVTLNPSSDSWVRTIRLEDVNVNINVSTSSNVSLNGGWGQFVGSQTTSASTVNQEDNIVATGTELYMRSRNTGFSAINLKPLTQFFQFLDSNSGVDFIPKLVEIATDSSLQNYGASAAFTVGETVVGTFGGAKVIKFRVAQSNHKEGTFNLPSSTYNINPYVKSENISESYSATSKILNIDTNGLCEQVQGLYSGYLTIGTKLVGQSSGAVAYVKDLRLISDNYGDLNGAFFIKNPNTTPSPSVRITTGSKTFKLTSSSTNETPLPGSKLISSGETIYKSEGTFIQKQKTITTTTTTTTINTYVDPLAQSFIVGGNSLESLNGNLPNDDANGVYLSAVDLFFAHKDSGNSPVTVEIRTVELGTPTRIVLGNPVTLKPDQINISNDGTIATKVTFDYPIYLAPNQEYSVVVQAGQSDQYELWIAEMGEKTVNTSTLPDAESVRYTKQFAIGSLFKSQNGSIWTANQYQDLKFKLYKCNFTSTSGSVFLQNPSLNESNGYIQNLSSDSLRTLPRNITVGITTTSNTTTIGILTTGRKVTEATKSYVYGYISQTGGPSASVGITTGGSNYTTTSNVGTYALSGNGKNLRLDITANGSGVITGVSINGSNNGNGYAKGDAVGIVTSDVVPVAGNGAIITITDVTSLDTLYLTNVQGESFPTVGVTTLAYYNSAGTKVSLSGTSILSSTPVGGLYSGNFVKVHHFDHGMYANTNKVAINGVKSATPPTSLSNKLLSTDTIISVGSTSDFATFEGVPVGGSNPGYVIIEDEIIRYESTGSGTLTTLTRGIDSTIALDHDPNILVYKYEFNGVSLRRINKTHDISDTGIDIDDYYIEIDRSNIDSNATNRNSDASLVIGSNSYPQLSFNSEFTGGGDDVLATENIQYDLITPQITALVPGSNTSISGQIRTVTGTSVDGQESSFIDQGYEDIEVTAQNKLTSTRIICSDINEQTYLSGGNLLRNKSFTLKVNLSTKDVNLSPMIFWKKSAIQLNSNRLNSPISDYAADGRVNDLVGDPHAAIYVSNTVRLAQSAKTLKVIVSAYRHSSSDFRVLYSLIRPDSSEVNQAFELFPGYGNLTIDNNGDGYPDVINDAKNSGLPDMFVPSSLNDEFLEYEFTAHDIGEFTGYTIKIVMSGTNQAYAPKLKDLRSIAIR